MPNEEPLGRSRCRIMAAGGPRSRSRSPTSPRVMDRPWIVDVKVGDWIVQILPKQHGRSKIPWYRAEPGRLSKGDGKYSDGLDRGTSFGPVEDVVDTSGTHGFISVRVPVPQMPTDMNGWPASDFPDSVWINVAKHKRSGGPSHWGPSGHWHKWFYIDNPCYPQHPRP